MSDEPADRVSISLVEERATISTRDVVTGKVRVRSETEVHETLARADLAGQEIEILRVPANKPLDSMPEIRTEGNVTIFPVVEEVLFVEKRLVLREEIHLIRKPTFEQVEVPVSLRRQRALVEDVHPETGQALPRDAGDQTKD
jgi:stress response protein YsnF